MLLKTFFGDAITEDVLEKLRRRAGGRGAVTKEELEHVSVLAERVRRDGDSAIVAATREWEQIELTPDTIRVSEREIDEAKGRLSAPVAHAIEASIRNATKFNESVRRPELQLSTIDDGVIVGQRTTPLSKVALYIPSGKGSYPSSFVTVAVPAVVAGVRDIQVLVPPKSDGRVDDAILYAARLLGIRDVYRGNGVTLTFAAAMGTKTIRRVDKIVGPGGPMIMAAQGYASLLGVDVAKYFGPSECMVIADDSADAELVASDLVNEAEHGMESTAILLTTSKDLASKVPELVASQVARLPVPRRTYAESAFGNSAVLVVESLDKAVELANDLANEHVQVVTKDPWSVANRLVSASEILVGQFTTFSAISYAIGVPACLPTGIASRVYSPVTVDTFTKRSAVAQLNASGLRGMATTIESLAEYEGFPAHHASIAIRRQRRII